MLERNDLHAYHPNRTKVYLSGVSCDIFKTALYSTDPDILYACSLVIQAKKADKIDTMNVKNNQKLMGGIMSKVHFLKIKSTELKHGNEISLFTFAKL